MANPLLVVHVQVQVKPEHIDAFRSATLANARESVKEPGVARFDVVQDREDPTRFVLIEVFRSEDAPAAHRETPHYKAWKEAVEPLQVGERTRRSFHAVFPEVDGW
jgi:autoinducer 2-degrading protein